MRMSSTLQEHMVSFGNQCLLSKLSGLQGGYRYGYRIDRIDDPGGSCEMFVGSSSGNCSDNSERHSGGLHNEELQEEANDVLIVLVWRMDGVRQLLC